jgi:hypothetical protein
MRALVTVVISLGLLGATTAVALWMWNEVGDAPISTQGLIALGLGAGFSFLLGAGLMALMFFSSRRGYDERAHDADPTRMEWRRSDPTDEG